MPVVTDETPHYRDERFYQVEITFRQFINGIEGINFLQCPVLKIFMLVKGKKLSVNKEQA